MIEPKFFFGALKQALELRMGQKRDRDYVSAPVFSDVDCKMTLWHVEREAIMVVVVAEAAVSLSQAGASLEDLLEDCCLW